MNISLLNHLLFIMIVLLKPSNCFINVPRKVNIQWYKFAPIPRFINNKVSPQIPNLGTRKHLSNQFTGLDDQKNNSESYFFKLAENQKKLQRLSKAEEVKTLISLSSGFGVLSTNSLEYPGYPTGSVVGFSWDKFGYPIFSFSRLAKHTKEIDNDGKASLTITSKDFNSLASSRVVIIGSIERVESSNDKIAIKELYLSKHKEANYVEFEDFSFYKMSKIDGIRFIGGFGNVTNVSVTDYINATPDPVSSFATYVIDHLNEDHKDSIVSMVKHFVGPTCSDATVVSIDKHGMDVLANIQELGGGSFKIRIPFSVVVNDRVQVKDVIVEMSKKAKAGH